MSKKFFIEFENYSGLKVPLSHKLYESAEAASNDAMKYIANGNYKSFSIKKLVSEFSDEGRRNNPSNKRWYSDDDLTQILGNDLGEYENWQDFRDYFMYDINDPNFLTPEDKEETMKIVRDFFKENDLPIEVYDYKPSADGEETIWLMSKITNESKSSTKKKPVKEGVLDSVDDDGWMAKSELYTLAKQAIELHRMINDTDQLDPWMQSKISRAKAYITSVKEHLDYRTHGMDVDTPAIPDAIDHDMFFENEDFSKMSDSKLEAWVKLNDTEDANPSFKKKLKKAKEELSSRQTNESEDPCWKGYKMVGTKKKGKKKVPNCVPESKITEHENYETYVNDLRKRGFKVYVSQEQSDSGWTFEVERNGKSVTIIEPETGSYYIQSDDSGKKYPNLKDAVRAVFKGKVSETTSSGGIAAVSQPLGTPAKRLKSKKKR